MTEKTREAATALARVYEGIDGIVADRGPGAAARALAEAGIRVFPVSAGPGEHEDVDLQPDGTRSGGNRDKKAKAPLFSKDLGFKRSFLDATTALPRVARAWSAWPTAMIGVPAEDNGVIVVDVDRSKWDEKRKQWSGDGLDTVKAWEEEHGTFTDTLRVRTPSDGWHLYFRTPPGDRITNSAGLYPGIDTRTNGYVIAPGSRTAEGKAYVLENPGAAILPLPQWLEDKLRNPPRKQTTASTAQLPAEDGTTDKGASGAGKVKGDFGDRACWRGADGWTNYGRKAVEGALKDVATAEVSTRHPTIYSISRHLGEVMAKGHIPLSEEGALRARLVDAGIESGVESKEVERTVRNGFDKGLANPAAAKVPDVEDAPSWWREDVTELSEDLARTSPLAMAGNRKEVGIERSEETAAAGRAVDAMPISSWLPLSSDDLTGFDCRRGLSVATCSEHHLGYTVAVGEDGATTPLIYIPTGDASGVKVDARPEAEVLRGYDREPTVREGAVEIFRGKALYTAERPIFVVMEEIDALSIVDAGGEAMALGVAGNADRLLKVLKASRPAQPLILALGEGEMAVKARATLVDGLGKLRIEPYFLDPAEGHVSVNAALVHDRAALEELMARLVDAQSVKDVLHDREEARLAELSTATALDDYLDRIAARSGGECEPTGFPILDGFLDGGLYPGLYVVGAVSGLGKTTFCLQIADYIAAAGRDVLIFSLEMSRDELIAKSLSRLTYQDSAFTSDWKTTRKILNSRFWQDVDDREIIERKIEAYRSTSGAHVFITEGIGDVGVARVKALVERFHSTRGVAPIVLVDYLQILAQVDPRMTDKQNVDRNVLELKRLSRDHNTTVIGISSFNRENYAASVNLSAFKESGAIEYSSDVVIGIQYKGMENVNDESDTARKKRTQSVLAEVEAKSRQDIDQTVQVKILKNRNGRRGDVFFTLCNRFNCYTELAQDLQDKYRREAMTPDPISTASAATAGDFAVVESTFGKETKKRDRKSKGDAGPMTEAMATGMLPM